MSNFTFIEFNFYPKYEKKLNLKVHLQYANIIHDFNSNNTIIIPNSKIENEYYTELFTVFQKDINYYSCMFQFNVYRGIVNYITYDTEKKSLPALEIIFYSKNNLPDMITYRGYEIRKYETKGNKYRRRFTIVNADTNQLQYINSKEFIVKNYKFSQDSYLALIRIPYKGPIKYSLSPIKEIKMGKVKKDIIMIKEEDIKLLQNFYQEYMMFLDLYNSNQKQYNKEIEVEILAQFELLNKLRGDIFNKYFYYFLLNPFGYKSEGDSLQLMHYYFYLNEFTFLFGDKGVDKNLVVNNIMRFSEVINHNHIIENNVYELLKNDNKLGDDEKVRIFRTVDNLIVKFIKSNKKINNIDYVKMEYLSKSNSYFKSIELLKNIIMNLDENSRLFEAFLYFDAGTIKNYLEENEIQDNTSFTNVFGEIVQYKYEKYKSEYGLNLLNVTDIQNHLMSLIPKIIIRVDADINFRGYYHDETNIMILNELALFNYNLSGMDYKFKGEDSDLYVIPITMEILHEMLSHGKLRFEDNNEDSPRNYADSKNNFDYKSIFKYIITDDNNFKIIPISESGRVLENYISENKEVILSLKTPCKENIKFINYKYWIGSNFDLLENEVKNNKKPNLSGSNMLVDEIIEKYTDEDCYVNKSRNKNNYYNLIK